MVRKRLVITDLTYMWDDEVCIAGVDREGSCVRPVTPSGVRRGQLFQHGQLVIYPRALVEFELSPVSIVLPPHIEDYYFDPDAVVKVIACNDNQWESVLKTSCFHSVEDIYDGLLEGGRRVPPEADTRSLGTICDAAILGVSIDDSYGRRQFRLDFVDASGTQYTRWPVNDLAFRAYLQQTLDMVGDLREAEHIVLQSLLSAERVYLRIGLARPRELGGYPPACWTQITGVYTFPDYIKGKTFADFEPSHITGTR